MESEEREKGKRSTGKENGGRRREEMKGKKVGERRGEKGNAAFQYFKGLFSFYIYIKYTLPLLLSSASNFFFAIF